MWGQFSKKTSFHWFPELIYLSVHLPTYLYWTCMRLWWRIQTWVRFWVRFFAYQLCHAQTAGGDQEAKCNFLVIRDNHRVSEYAIGSFILYYWWLNSMESWSDEESYNKTEFCQDFCPVKASPPLGTSPLCLYTQSPDSMHWVMQNGRDGKETDEWYILSRPFIPTQKSFHPTSLPMCL